MFNGSGVYSAPSLPGSWNPAQTGSQATPNDWNTLLADLSLALTTTLCRDGQSTVIGNIGWNGFRLTNLGSAISLTDSTTAGQVQNATATFAEDTGAADAYAIAPTPACSAYQVGQQFQFQVANANLTTTPTLAVSGLHTGVIEYANDAALNIGDLVANAIVNVAVASVTLGVPVFYLLTLSIKPISLGGNNAWTGTNTFVTQTAGDNSNKAATTAYADNLVVNGRVRALANITASGSVLNYGTNIASIVNNSTGHWTINFAAANPANSVPSVTLLDASNSGGIKITALSTTSLSFQAYSSNGTPLEFTGYFLQVLA